MIVTALRATRVLVVEESAAVGNFLCQLLGSGGVVTARAARRCDVEAALLHDEVDVVVLSNSRGGIAATTALVRSLRGRPEPSLRDAALIALVDDATDALFGLADLTDAVLVRPVDATELRQRIHSLSLTNSG